MEKERISDLPTYSKIRNDAKGFFLLGKVIKFFTFFSSKNPDLAEALSKLPELKKQAEYLSSIPDRFNTHFSSQGWIAHESMNSPLMERTILLADEGNIKLAEEELSNYFTSTQIDWLLNRFQTRPELSIRYKLIKLAYQDTIEKRYYSCIPLLLLIIDGIVNDISKSKGFFAEKTDLTAWDSIAAHSSGLTAIREIFNSGRNKTNKEEIFLPYRNGILHGRDVKYDNKYVASKCWCTLFAIFDWIQAIQKQKDNPPVPEKTPTVKESLRDLKNVIQDYQKHKISHSRLLKDIEEWKPRLISDTEINVDNFGKFTPEKEVHDLATNWLNKNYGKIAEQKYYFGSKNINLGKEAGKIRNELFDKELKEFNIISIKDEAPAISEIVLEIKYQIDEKEMQKKIVLRMICKTENNGTGINGQQNIMWKFIDSFMYNLYV